MLFTTRTAALVSWCLAAPAVALAAPVVDTFESGGLRVSDTPPGVWADDLGLPGGNTLATSPDAAHRGARGLRLVDNNTATNEHSEGRLALGVSSSPTSRRLRFWFRVTPNAGTSGTIVLGQISRANPMLELFVDVPSGRLRAGGFDSPGSYRTDDISKTLTFNEWHVVELIVTDATTRNGVRRVWLDGEQVMQRTGIDWNASTPQNVRVGQPNSTTGNFTGVIDLDDVMVDSAPLASSLRAVFDQRDGAARAGDCLPLTLSLVSVDGTAVAAPYDVRTQPVITEIQGALFADAQCSTAAGEVVIPSGAMSGQFYARASTSGILRIEVPHPDFFPSVTGYAIEAGVTPNGESCQVAGACASTFCVEGFCCDTSCTAGEVCQRCSAAGGASANGVCTVLPASACVALPDICPPGQDCSEQPPEPLTPDNSNASRGDRICDETGYCIDTGCGCGADGVAGPLGALALIGMLTRKRRSQRRG